MFSPRSVCPRSVCPRSVCPRSVCPRSVCPRSVFLRERVSLLDLGGSSFSASLSMTRRIVSSISYYFSDYSIFPSKPGFIRKSSKTGIFSLQEFRADSSFNLLLSGILSNFLELSLDIGFGGEISSLFVDYDKSLLDWLSTEGLGIVLVNVSLQIKSSVGLFEITVGTFCFGTLSILMFCNETSFLIIDEDILSLGATSPFLIDPINISESFKRLNLFLLSSHSGVSGIKNKKTVLMQIALVVNQRI